MRYWKEIFMFVGCGAVALTGCGSENSGPGPGADLTYYQDIKPILDAKCVQCHYAGGIAPFSLATYENATTYAGVSKLAIEAGTMPPWHANDECADYMGNRSLTEDQKATILAWIDSDRLEGDAANPGQPLETETTTLSRVDLSLSMPEAYAPQTTTEYRDDYRCFLLEWPEEATTYVSGFRAVPGNELVVHHVIAFLATPDQADQYRTLDANEPGPGYDCFGGTGGPANQWVGAWAPGGQGSDLPAGLGMEVQPGSLIVLQVHYNTLNVAPGSDPAADLTSLEFKLDDQVEKTALILPWANPLWILSDSMNIPANEADVMHEFEYDATVAPQVESDSFQIYSAGLHMHLLGKSGRLSVERSDGSSECLLQVDAWDFAWQESYAFRTPTSFQTGDKLRIECHWDNTAANQPVVNGEALPPQDVAWGEGSTDEMCLGIFLVAW